MRKRVIHKRAKMPGELPPVEALRALARLTGKPSVGLRVCQGIRNTFNFGREGEWRRGVVCELIVENDRSWFRVRWDDWRMPSGWSRKRKKKGRYSLHDGSVFGRSILMEVP